MVKKVNWNQQHYWFENKRVREGKKPHNCFAGNCHWWLKENAVFFNNSSTQTFSQRESERKKVSKWEREREGGRERERKKEKEKERKTTKRIKELNGTEKNGFV
jgi:hypothetical protein